MVAIDGLDRPAYSGRRVLLFTPAGEFHEIPVLFMYYLLKKRGVPGLYLGKNATLETVQEVCNKQHVSEIYFHLVTNLIKCDLSEYLKQVSSMFPDKQIHYSGSEQCMRKCSFPNVTMLRDRDEMLEYAGHSDTVSSRGKFF